MSQSKNTALLKGLLEAMRAEHEGEHFYRMAAKATDNPKGREVLSQLALEEREHARFLKAQYESILETGNVDKKRKLGEKLRLFGDNPIFSGDFRTRLKGAHAEMTNLSIGIKLEMSAMDHYGKLAKQAEDPEVAAFFSALREWETGHYRALLEQYDMLQEEYWADNGFAPF
ncbi:MAG: ferritin family protein [Proteobacteria bacterium]|nr:ferritin family protein [Pseudomonadota bacterium]